MTSGHHVRRHQSLTVSGVLIVGDDRSSLLKRELTFTDIGSDGVETTQRTLDGLVGDDRLTEDMTHVDLIATFLDELDDMEAELRLHDLRHLLRIGETKGHLGEGRIEGTTTNKS